MPGVRRNRAARGLHKALLAVRSALQAVRQESHKKATIPRPRTGVDGATAMQAVRQGGVEAGQLLLLKGVRPRGSHCIPEGLVQKADKPSAECLVQKVWLGRNWPQGERFLLCQVPEGRHE